MISLAFPILHLINKEERPAQAASAAPLAPQATPSAAPPPQLPPQATPSAVSPPQLPPPDPPKPVQQQPLVWEGTYEPPPKALPQYKQANKGKGAVKKDPGPDLTAETLVGTAWQVNSPYGPVAVEFGPNGQGVAVHQMIGQIPAKWRVQGNKVIANASAMGQSITIDATIQGQSLIAPGQQIIRVR